jgi:hypothetical protein
MQKFKDLSKLGKTAIIYSIVLGLYEVCGIIAYIKNFIEECAMYGESASNYIGYIISNVLDNYVVIPAGIIILSLLCVKLLESKRTLSQEPVQPEELHDKEAFTGEAALASQPDDEVESTIEEQAQTEDEVAEKIAEDIEEAAETVKEVAEEAVETVEEEVEETVEEKAEETEELTARQKGEKTAKEMLKTAEDVKEEVTEEKSSE